jgi:hypothetical protein
MSSQLISAMFLGLFFGILTESFEDVHEHIGHIFLGCGLTLALVTAAFFLQSVRFYGEAANAVAVLCVGSVIGWKLSECINAHWSEKIQKPDSNDSVKMSGSNPKIL